MCEIFSLRSVTCVLTLTGIVAGTNGTANGSVDGSKSPDNFEALDKEALIKQLRKVGHLLTPTKSQAHHLPSPACSLSKTQQDFGCQHCGCVMQGQTSPKLATWHVGVISCVQQFRPQPPQAFTQLLPRCNTASKLLSLGLHLCVLLPMPCLSICAEQLSVNWQYFEIAKLHSKPYMHCLR